MTLDIDQDAGETIHAQQPTNTLYDKDGFFVDPTRWSPTLAQRLARAEGLGELDTLQMEMLHRLRLEFSKHHSVSALSHLCHVQGLEPDCLHRLFVTPRQAWRLAGLPNPGEEAKAYLA